jgi:hypothetical protein
MIIRLITIGIPIKNSAQILSTIISGFPRMFTINELPKRTIEITHWTLALYYDSSDCYSDNFSSVDFICESLFSFQEVPRYIEILRIM